MWHGGAHIDLFKAAETLRSDASLSSRTADFILRVFLAFALIGGALFALAALMFGAGVVASVIFHSISIVSGN